MGCQTPLYVASKLSKMRASWPMVPTPDQFVRSALAHVGYSSVTAPYWSHALQLWAGSLIPESIVANSVTAPMHLKIRKIALKKKAIQQAFADAEVVDDDGFVLEGDAVEVAQRFLSCTPEV